MYVCTKYVHIHMDQDDLTHLSFFSKGIWLPILYILFTLMFRFRFRQHLFYTKYIFYSLFFTFSHFRPYQLEGIWECNLNRENMDSSLQFLTAQQPQRLRHTTLLDLWASPDWPIIGSDLRPVCVTHSTILYNNFIPEIQGSPRQRLVDFDSRSLTKWDGASW